MELNIIWFILIVVLFSGYVVLDGFDLGVGMLHFNAQTDEERRINLNAIGPVWDGNEVWLITAGGALFAAFPDVYATIFSGFYTAFMLFLLVIIGRAVSIEFRSKVDSVSWKKVWDVVFNISSYLIVLLLGVSLGNIISGMPIAADMEYAGTFLGLLNPYAIFIGLTVVITLRLHGLLYISQKTGGDYQERCLSTFWRSYILFLIFYTITHIWTMIAHIRMTDNFIAHPVWFIVPAIALISIILIPINFKKKKLFGAFVFSCIMLICFITIVAIGIYPNLVISEPIPENSLTIFKHSSSQMTLWTMFIIALIGVPIMLFYKIMVYRIFRGKVEIDSSSY